MVILSVVVSILLVIAFIVFLYLTLNHSKNPQCIIKKRIMVEFALAIPVSLGVLFFATFPINILGPIGAIYCCYTDYKKYKKLN